MTNSDKPYIYSDTDTHKKLSVFAEKLGIPMKKVLALILRYTKYEDVLNYLDKDRKSKK